jgi:hypothetical protein
MYLDKWLLAIGANSHKDMCFTDSQTSDLIIPSNIALGDSFFFFFFLGGVALGVELRATHS